ncbi:MAG: ankyrin repeat domain-containing protein [Proteobacteria bacterium]|nr:ankyrin repeat domain-containing protein [Pseudomonadota bacterium]
MISVTVTDKDGTSTTSTFNTVGIRIGRTREIIYDAKNKPWILDSDKYNDVVLPAKDVSRRHARIVIKYNQLKDTEQLILVDCKSTQGTFLNGHKISAPSLLFEGDKVFIGDFALDVQLRIDPELAALLDRYYRLTREIASTAPINSPADPSHPVSFPRPIPLPVSQLPIPQVPETSAAPINPATELIEPDTVPDVYARDNQGRTPLHTCKRFCNVKRLIEAGADVNARDNQGRTLMHMPICWNDNVVKCLIEAGADVNARDNEGQTPLHICEHVAMARALIEAGADINIKDNLGRTPLDTYHNQSILDVLVKAIERQGER